MKTKQYKVNKYCSKKKDSNHELDTELMYIF